MSESTNRLTGILAAAARRMRADFDDSARIVHRGEKGGVREYDLLSFLDRYLPRNVQALGSAEVVSVDGQCSPQMDIVICDPSTPPLFDRGGYRIVPAECVYAVIEIKSMLDRPAMKTSQQNLSMVKRMPKTAYFPQLITPQPQVYGRTYDGYFPTQGYIFAYDSIDLENFIDNEAIMDYRRTPHDQRVDGVWVLGKGMLNWINPETQAPNANSEPGLWLAAGKPPADGDVLLNMVLLVCTRMAQVSMLPFNLIPYADNADMAEDISVRGPVEFWGP